MSDREPIFTAIRKALEPLQQRTPMPEWDDAMVLCRPSQPYPNLTAQFADKLAFANSQFFDDRQALAAYLRDSKSTFGYCDPALAEHFSQLEGITFDTEWDRSKVDAYAFGITAATAGIAESGTIMLRDQDTSSRLAALAPWQHIAVLRETDIVASIAEAIQRFGDDPCICFATGPSKTADVEGILIEGVHGPGIQIAYLIRD